MHKQLSAYPRRQRGTALITSLIFLLLLTIMGITAVGTATLEERMAGNMKDQYLAFQAAESALRYAESQLANMPAAPPLSAALSNDADIDVVAFGTVTDPATRDRTWWITNGEEYGGTTTRIEGVADDPRFVIEERQRVEGITLNASPDGLTYYRITARGVGATRSAQVVLQSTYALHN